VFVVADLSEKAGRETLEVVGRHCATISEIDPLSPWTIDSSMDFRFSAGQGGAAPQQ
jgi:hypothetical protein